MNSLPLPPAESTVDRRTFLKLSGLAGGLVLSGGAIVVGSVGRRPRGALAQAEKVVFAYPDYPDVVVAKLADIQPGTPIFFDYPQAGQRNMLVQLAVPAEEGIGPDQNIIAFSVFCPHMGVPLDAVYDHTHALLGPCPLHFSTYDLSRSGMMVMGKATDHLPQVVLTINDAGEIRATGMYGLIYGWPANLMKLDGGS